MADLLFYFLIDIRKLLINKACQKTYINSVFRITITILSLNIFFPWNKISMLFNEWYIWCRCNKAILANSHLYECKFITDLHNYLFAIILFNACILLHTLIYFFSLFLINRFCCSIFSIFLHRCKWKVWRYTKC